MKARIILYGFQIGYIEDFYRTFDIEIPDAIATVEIVGGWLEPRPEVEP